MGDLGSTPGLGRSPGAGHVNPLQNSCLENPCGQRSLVGYSPCGHKESDTTERLSTHTSIAFFLSSQCLQCMEMCSLLPLHCNTPNFALLAQVFAMVQKCPDSPPHQTSIPPALLYQLVFHIDYAMIFLCEMLMSGGHLLFNLQDKFTR